MTAISKHQKLATALALLVGLATLFVLMPVASHGETAGEVRAKIEAKRQREQQLSTGINRVSQRVQSLRGRISKLQQRQSVLEGDLNKKVSRQQAIAKDLKASRKRLARLREKLAHSKVVLARRIVAVYKADKPDMLTVVLNSEGFGDLVERTTYLRHVSDQDSAVIDTVTQLKGETRVQTKKLATLESEASRLVAQVRARRDEVANAKGQLAARQGSLNAILGQRKGMLANVQVSRRKLEDHLASLEASNQTVVNFLGNIPAGPIKHGTGQLIWPINGTFSSPFGYRWGHLHAGIDIADPIGTPIRAADGGRVAYAGWMSGYGNYTCIQHTGSMSTCYGHQSSIGVSVGQQVSQGDVIGNVGNTGHSFGPHLHFEVRINGNPVDPMGYL
ncbi:MAG: peptidoglycan DD-metalloendopeptidase family protein [Thermoleophilaceae bacterium]|nr:peptidoglycan DD-metalloendopeptidase family protein [Thermoleophilaceae bacterium]